MARRKAEPEPSIQPREFRSPEEIDRAIAKLDRRIKELEALDVAHAISNDTAADDTAIHNVRTTILEIFGEHSPEFQQHKYIRLWAGPMFMDMEQYDIIQATERGRTQTIGIIRGLIGRTPREARGVRSSIRAVTRGSLRKGQSAPAYRKCRATTLPRWPPLGRRFRSIKGADQLREGGVGRVRSRRGATGPQGFLKKQSNSCRQRSFRPNGSGRARGHHASLRGSCDGSQKSGWALLSRGLRTAGNGVHIPAQHARVHRSRSPKALTDRDERR